MLMPNKFVFQFGDDIDFESGNIDENIRAFDERDRFDEKVRIK